MLLRYSPPSPPLEFAATLPPGVPQLDWVLNGDTMAGLTVMQFAGRDIDLPAYTIEGHELHVNLADDVDCELEIDGRRRRVNSSAGEGMLIPTGCRVGWRGRMTRSLVVSIAPSLMDDVLEREFEIDPVSRHVPSRLAVVAQPLARCVMELRSLAHRVPTSRSLPLDRLAREVTALIAQHVVGAVPLPCVDRALTAREVGRVEGLLEATLDRARVSDLAAVCGLSSRQFQRAFKRTTGSSPARYVLERRVDYARQLLSTTDLPLASVAAATGFFDQSHMSRVLRQLLGQTPGMLRRSR